MLGNWDEEFSLAELIRNMIKKNNTMQICREKTLGVYGSRFQSTTAVFNEDLSMMYIYNLPRNRLDAMTRKRLKRTDCTIDDINRARSLITCSKVPTSSVFKLGLGGIIGRIGFASIAFKSFVYANGSYHAGSVGEFLTTVRFLFPDTRASPNHPYTLLHTRRCMARLAASFLCAQAPEKIDVDPLLKYYQLDPETVDTAKTIQEHRHFTNGILIMLAYALALTCDQMRKTLYDHYRTRVNKLYLDILAYLANDVHDCRFETADMLCDGLAYHIRLFLIRSEIEPIEDSFISNEDYLIYLLNMLINKSTYTLNTEFGQTTYTDVGILDFLFIPDELKLTMRMCIAVLDSDTQAIPHIAPVLVAMRRVYLD